MAQNSKSFFKVALTPNTDMPQWAQEMYSQDPDVFMVDGLYSEYYAQNSFQKNIHTQNYKHWRRKVNEQLNADGFIRPISDEARIAILN